MRSDLGLKDNKLREDDSVSPNEEKHGSIGFWIAKLMMILIAIMKEEYVSSSNLECLVLRTYCRWLEVSSYLV